MTAEELALIGIDSVTVVKVFAWGFAAIYLSWAVGFGIGTAVRLVRQI